MAYLIHIWITVVKYGESLGDGIDPELAKRVEGSNEMTHKFLYRGKIVTFSMKPHC